jgi:heavy metal efflux system protein
VLKHAHEQPNRPMDRLRAAYARGLAWVFARGALVVSAAVVVVLAPAGSLAYIGTEFMPKLDEGNILITSRRLPSVSLAEATRLSLEMEKIITQFPEVVTVVTKEGRPDLATEAMGLFEGDTYVILKPRKEWTTAKDSEGLVEALDSALAVIPGLEIAFTQPLAMRWTKPRAAYAPISASRLWGRTAR